MNPQEQRVRDDLAVLAASDRGRELLQLALRGIGRGDRAVTAGCWADRGVAGCLFQHAYWQGVRDGVFHADDPARDWVSSFVGRGDYWNVIRAIEAFDELGRLGHSDRVPRRVLGSRTVLRQAEWREVVTGLLLDALYGGLAAPVPTPEPVPAR